MASVNVIGAGVVGLTCALDLVGRGYKVTVIGRELPEDIESTGFASPWAGGFWHSFEVNGDDRKAQWDRYSFEKLRELADKDQSLVQTIETYEYFKEEPIEESYGWFFRNLCPDGRRLTHEEVASRRPGHTTGIVYKTFSFNPARYLPYLRRELASRGVKFVRRRLSVIDEAFTPLVTDTGIPQVDVVVNATGLGALSLLGVEDCDVLPYRGQTILVRLPKPLAYSTLEGFDKYIICRPSTETGEPGREAILGGCYQAGNWDTTPDPALAERILKDCVEILPELSKDGTVEGVEVLKHNVGLRPGRKGGARLESEERWLPSKGVLVPAACKVVPAREVTVVHCYGISGGGYQASFGMAKEVGDHVDAAFTRRRATQ